MPVLAGRGRRAASVGAMLAGGRVIPAGQRHIEPISSGGELSVKAHLIDRCPHRDTCLRRPWRDRMLPSRSLGGDQATVWPLVTGRNAPRDEMEHPPTPFPVTGSLLSARALLTTLLPAYDIGTPTDCTLWASGVNDVYRVLTAGGEYFLKVYRAG